jgi:hypothetical protein
VLCGALEQLIFRKTADFDEGVVAVGDDAACASVVEINRCCAGKVRSRCVMGWLFRMSFSIQEGFERLSARDAFY